MSYQVSSWFQTQLQSRTAEPVRRFEIENHVGGSWETFVDSYDDWAVGVNSNSVVTSDGFVGVSSDSDIYLCGPSGNTSVRSIDMTSWVDTMHCITIDAWVRPEANARYSSLFQANPNDSANRLNCHFPWVDGIIYWDFGDSSSERLTKAWNSAWNHVYGHWVFRAGSGQPMTIHRDGVLVASGGFYHGPFAPGTKELGIAAYLQTGSYWIGRVANFRVWSSYIPDTDISSLSVYKADGSEVDLLLCLPFDEGSGSYARDITTNANTGYIVSPVWSSHPSPYPSYFTSSEYAPTSNALPVATSSLTWSASLNGQGLALQTRVSTDAGSNWGAWTAGTDASPIDTLPDTITADTRLQFRAVFSMSDINTPGPLLDSVGLSLVTTAVNSDYSDRVLKWPTVKRDWNSVRPQSVNVDLANEDGALNFFYQSNASLAKRCLVRFGFTHPTSGDELVTLYSGKTDHMQYDKGKATLSLLDKFKQLTEREVGTNDAPVTFTDSATPPDIAWAVVTSWGGYSGVQSTSNPDIDYQSWLDWAAVFSADGVYMNGNIQGKKCSEVLAKLADYTQSAIFVENDMLTFRRFSAADSAQTVLDNDSILDLSLEVNDADIVNRQYVLGGYNVSVDTWTITGLSVNTTSVNTFGARDQTQKSDFVWYVDSTSANVQATRETYVKAMPYPKLRVRAPLVPAVRQIGDTITVTDEQRGISGESYRLMGYQFNLDTGEFETDIDASQYSGQFTLDVSTLDNTTDLLL